MHINSCFVDFVLLQKIMGCSISQNMSSPQNSPIRRQATNTGVQDDARSFRSKHSAIKMLTKNKLSCQALTDYLKTQNKSELLTCYMDLEEIRQLTEEQALTRASALVWRYKSLFESVRKTEQHSKVKGVEVVIWECLGRLRYVDGGSIEMDHLLKMISNAQNDLLSKLILPFEGFLQSKQYRAWQDAHVLDEKSRQVSRGNLHGGVVEMSSSSSSAGGNQANIPPSASMTSLKQETLSAIYSNVLIVDDSLVTLKLARLTLENDGHNVDKALNGQIALEMLKQRMYDVVLIDCNMPVMDGFETIRVFREYEQGHVRQLTAPIPKRMSKMGHGAARADDDGNVSDLSDDEALQDNDGSPGRTSSRFAIDGYNRANRTSSLRHPGAHADSPVPYAPPSQLIIGMSTDVDADTRRRALAAGMDYFLPKPFTLQKFTEIIRDSMEKNQTNRTRMSNEDSVSSIPIFNNNTLYSP